MSDTPTIRTTEAIARMMAQSTERDAWRREAEHHASVYMLVIAAGAIPLPPKAPRF